MRWRLALLRRHGPKLADIRNLIGGMVPLPGAKELLDALRSRCQVAILSDTFYEFVDPLMAQFGRPTLVCNWLVVDDEGFVTDYRPPSIAAQFPKLAVHDGFAGLRRSIDPAVARCG